MPFPAKLKTSIYPLPYTLESIRRDRSHRSPSYFRLEILQLCFSKWTDVIFPQKILTAYGYNFFDLGMTSCIIYIVGVPGYGIGYGISNRDGLATFHDSRRRPRPARIPRRATFLAIAGPRRRRPAHDPAKRTPARPGHGLMALSLSLAERRSAQHVGVEKRSSTSSSCSSSSSVAAY